MYRSLWSLYMCRCNFVHIDIKLRVFPRKKKIRNTYFIWCMTLRPKYLPSILKHGYCTKRKLTSLLYYILILEKPLNLKQGEIFIITYMWFVPERNSPFRSTSLVSPHLSHTIIMDLTPKQNSIHGHPKQPYTPKIQNYYIWDNKYVPHILWEVWNKDWNILSNVNYGYCNKRKLTYAFGL